MYPRTLCRGFTVSKSYPTLPYPSRGAFIGLSNTTCDPETFSALQSNLCSFISLTTVPGWEYGIEVAYFQPPPNPS